MSDIIINDPLLEIPDEPVEAPAHLQALTALHKVQYFNIGFSLGKIVKVREVPQIRWDEIHIEFTDDQDNNFTLTQREVLEAYNENELQVKGMREILALIRDKSYEEAVRISQAALARVATDKRRAQNEQE